MIGGALVRAVRTGNTGESPDGAWAWRITNLKIAVFSVFIWAHNYLSKRPVVGDAPIDLNLTTYGRRRFSVFLTIESISRNYTRPRRVILWLDEPFAKTPRPIERLIKRGLEVRPTLDYGPHKKYYPYVEHSTQDSAFATADDDVFYPRNWFGELYSAFQTDPAGIQAQRCRVPLRDDCGDFLEYSTWPELSRDYETQRPFFTGVGGVIFPASMHSALRALGDTFMHCCPRADDVWLNLVASREGISVEQCSASANNYWPRLRTESGSLAMINVHQHGNDDALKDTLEALGMK